jgi:hypothetical protein
MSTTTQSGTSAQWGVGTSDDGWELRRRFPDELGDVDEQLVGMQLAGSGAYDVVPPAALGIVTDVDEPAPIWRAPSG